MFHGIDHSLVAVAIYKAGEATTYRQRVGWLALAALAVARCHLHHHGRTR